MDTTLTRENGICIIFCLYLIKREMKKQTNIYSDGEKKKKPLENKCILMNSTRQKLPFGGLQGHLRNTAQIDI